MRMNFFLFMGAVGLLACACAVSARGQDPGLTPARETRVPDVVEPPAAAPPPPKPAPTVEEVLERTARELKALKEEHARELDRQRKQAELQQKQIEVLEKTTQLLAEQVKKQAPAPASVEAIETKTDVLEARARNAAQRDRELADATDALSEKLDAQGRRSLFPYTARELFLPTQTNETPLAIYGQLLGGYSRQNAMSGMFQSPSFSPWFLLQLNQRFLLEVNVGFSTRGVGLGQAQLDWFVNDATTVVAGRFLTPIGSFNERLSPAWINKLPSIPVMFRQVIPLTLTDGLQIRGARYLGGLPLKLEYSFYGGNGFQFTQKPTTPTPVANLQGLTNGPDVNTSTAYGGRLGLWAPIHGLNFGFSGYTNGIYSPGSQNHYALWDFDFNYHWGNWDFRAEYGNNYQEATSFLKNNITRQGLYTQLAYRNYQCENPYLQKLEGVFRYGFAHFTGINPATLNQTAFPTPFDIPVSRDQYTLGINYYFYPSMVLRLAYEINRERGGLNLRDDVFLAQGVWAF
jgi:hypothetical protein